MTKLAIDFVYLMSEQRRWCYRVRRNIRILIYSLIIRIEKIYNVHKNRTGINWYLMRSNLKLRNSFIY